MATPLLAVTLFFRSKPEFESLPHVIDAVSIFLDSSVEVPLSKACKFQSFTLLNRLWTSAVDLSTSCWSVRRLLRTEKYYQQFQFVFSLLEVVKRQDLETIRWLFERFSPEYCYVNKQVVEQAASVGAVEILRYFLQHTSNLADDDEATAPEEQRRVVQWGDIDAAKAAAAGHGEVVRFLYTNTPEFPREGAATLDAVVSSGDVQPLDWLLLPAGAALNRGVHGAAANGHFDIVARWFPEDPTDPRCAGVLLKAAENGHLDIVRWLIKRDWNNEELDSESESDSDDDDYFYDCRDKASRLTHITSLGGEASLSIHAAAVNGHLEVAKFLHTRVDSPIYKGDWSVRRDRESHTKAAILKQLGRDHNAQRVSNRTMLIAAKKGLLEVVQWLYADLAALKGHMEMLQWLHTNRSEGCSLGAMDWAAIYGHFDAVKWLHENTNAGCTTLAMDGAASVGHLEMVTLLHENRSEGCTHKAMDHAAQNGALNVVKFLHKNRFEGCSHEALQFAASEGQLQMIPGC